MSGWDWLTHGKYHWRFIGRVMVKALVLFMALNVLFALCNGTQLINHLTIYNLIVAGRERLPYGEHPQAYNLSIDDFNAMLRSHVVARPKGQNEFRVFLIGDSSVWGVLLKPDETLAAYLNAMDLTADDRREMVFHNLGYPTMSLLKDAMLLDAALPYQPDMIVWLTTLQSLWRGDQFDNPIAQNNPARASKWMALPTQGEDDFWSRTIIGQRRELADWFRLQLYGISWATMGVDQFYPDPYTPLQTDYERDLLKWKTFDTPTNLEGELLFDLLRHASTGLDIPLLLVNEPIYISSGQGSDQRYNFFYPRWAYDQYRELYGAFASENNIPYLDLWDFIDPSQFTDTAVHITPAASKQFAERIATEITAMFYP